MSRLLPLAILAAVAALSFSSGAAVSYAVLSDQESSQGVFSTGTWSTPQVSALSAWAVSDAADGSASDESDPLGYAADGVVYNTGNWATSFSASRYLRWDWSAGRPTGLAVSGASFDFRMIPNAGGDTACYHFEVRRASDNALLATHGSSGSPVACITGTTYATVSTALPEVSTTDIANDLRIVLFGNEDNARRMKIDQAVVTGSTTYGSFTQHETAAVDASTGGAATVSWPLAISGDGVAYLTRGNWNSSFQSNRYLKFTFDPRIPAGATITGATFEHAYRSNNAGNTACTYIEVYDGASLIGSHGSSGSPRSCNATGAFVSDSVSLPEVTTALTANNLAVRVYMRESGGKKTQSDLVRLTVNFTLP